MEKNMRKMNLLKVAMLAMTITLLYGGTAKAAETEAPDTTASSEILYTTSVSVDNPQVKEMMQKQLEVDKTLFEDKVKDLEDKGITVTYTAPLETAVEVAIIPFNTENENFVYDLLGKDNISVVEGVAPELIYASGAATGEEPVYKGEEAQEPTKNLVDDGIMTIQGDSETVTDDQTAGTGEETNEAELTSTTVDPSKAAESGITKAAPVSAEINTAAQRSPVVIGAVITFILLLSGIVYFVQRKKEAK